MPTYVKVWDQVPDDKDPTKVAEVTQREMTSLIAKEAVARDPKRYSFDDPRLAKPEKVDRTEPAREPVTVEIPADWERMNWQARKRLAAKLGAERSATSDIVNAIIAAEFRRRAVVDITEGGVTKTLDESFVEPISQEPHQ